MAADPSHSYNHPALTRLAELSASLAGEPGRTLHALYVEYLRSAADGTLLRRGSDDEADGDPIPAWPGSGEDDPLEESFGRHVDRLRRVTREDVEKLQRGEAPDGTAPGPDLTRPGDLGERELGAREWVNRVLHDSPDSGRHRIEIQPLPACGGLWRLMLIYYERAPKCEGLNYARAYRATLLRAFAEAFKCCRKRDAACPDARLWLLLATWDCDTHAGQSKMTMELEFVAQCLAA